MNAWLWAANFEKWRGSKSANPYEALRHYVEDTSRYVYWSTPRFQNAIKNGDRAYLWLSRAGLIAEGYVHEAPKKDSFDYRDRLQATGWDEASATSEFKTGIKLSRTFWNTPLVVAGLFDRPNTVFDVKGDKLAQIRSVLERRNC